MKYLFLFISALIVLSCTSCGQQGSQEKNNTYLYTNHLIHESSPYLLMHAHNPVNWYPWGKEALEKAVKENKPIIISIGYAACHWCHVMEKESYSDTAVARLMNDNFISIKVDREERPDVDQVYMNVAQLIHGSGGWPLNAIALPNGQPVYAGTYYPRNEWLSLLHQILKFIRETPEKAKHQAASIMKGMRQSDIITLPKERKTTTLVDLKNIFKHWQKDIDTKNGGTIGAPKFPMPVGYRFLLHYYFLTKDPAALDAVTTTLNKMAAGGIYDHVGGGFARYSTDAQWKIPHFEKMLYDNAQLVSLYSTAYQQTKNPLYKKIVYETLDFIERELTSSENGFYSSLDADSEGEEGKFYLWTKDQIETCIGANGPLVSKYFNVTTNGNLPTGKLGFQKKQNILYVTEDEKTFAKNNQLSDSQWQKILSFATKKLLAERNKRKRPPTDNKILTSWNALMIKGYVDAYRVFNEPRFLQAAIHNANFILQRQLQPDFRLDRNYKNGQSSINGFLDDYANTISSFIDLYQATFNEKWLIDARHLLQYTKQHFSDSATGLFFYTSDIDPALITRKMEIADNVIPSSNSVMAQNLFQLGQYFYNDEYIQQAEKMANTIKQSTITGNAFYANWDNLLAWLAQPPYEVAIVGSDFSNIRKSLDQHYLPNIFLSGGAHEGSLQLLENKLVIGQTTIYVCQNKLCKKPVTDIQQALLQLQ